MRRSAAVSHERVRASARAKYPSAWKRDAKTRDGVPYRIRPIRATDAKREREFICGLSAQSRYNRLMYTLREPSAALIEQLVDVDYHATMAFLAVVGRAAGEQIIGVARYAADGSGRDCEFGVAVADDWQARGVGTTLMRLLFDYARVQGFRRMYGAVLSGNERMLHLADWLGLTSHSSPDDTGQLTVSLDLMGDAGQPQA